MDVDGVLRARYISDLRKPDIDNRERAIILKKVMEESGWSQRQLAREYGFNHSTVQDWLLWDDDRVETLEEQGYSDTQIYRVLRNTKKSSQNIPKGTNSKAQGNVNGAKKKLTEDEIVAQAINEELRGMAVKVKGFVAKQKYDSNTEDFAKGLINECNRLCSMISRQEKKGVHKSSANGEEVEA